MGNGQRRARAALKCLAAALSAGMLASTVLVLIVWLLSVAANAAPLVPVEPVSTGITAQCHVLQGDSHDHSHSLHV